MAALQNRDSNAQPTSNAEYNEKNMSVGTENNPEETAQHKGLLGQRNGNGAYVSPSDAIQSPASQKLQGFKQRQINKQQNGKNNTSRLLFARTPSGNNGGIDEVVSQDGEKPQ